MTAIYKKELRGYFQTVTGYVFIALFLAVVGLFTSFYNFRNAYPDFEYVLYSVSFVFLLTVPLLTMRSFAEERRRKTDQLLYSLPVRTSQIVIGKYLAMLTVYGAAMLITCFYPVILASYGEVNFTASYACIFAYFFLGAALIAVGAFMSTLTDSQAVSAVLAFGALLFLYLMSDIAAMIPAMPVASAVAAATVAALLLPVVYHLTQSAVVTAAVGGALGTAIVATYLAAPSLYESLVPSLLNKASLFERFYPFVNGVMDLGAVIYYITVACLFVFFSVQSLEKRRWS